ncbi:unnamed protein product [Ambrosiozyma monospora]|uniref:Unnamed protein product n=1 Tax=Ambrosiozyma monospora TaxID=43982 RepID=A0ACB5TTZ4_AMBMO|nr:unnamed protein product [Ambrosiozyma monospora]
MNEKLSKFLPFQQAPPPQQQQQQQQQSGGVQPDITIKAFNSIFPLHKNVLNTVPFFHDLLTPPAYTPESTGQYQPPPRYTGNLQSVQFEDSNVFVLNFQDPRITLESFDLMLKRVYGNPDVAAEQRIAGSVNATFAFFGVGSFELLQQQTPPYSTNGLNNAMGNMSLSGNARCFGYRW